MRAIIRRELIVAARRPAVGIAASAIALVLVAFVLVWAPGLPLLPDLNLYEQARVLDRGLLTIVLPWLAARIASADREDAFVRLSALTAVPPATLVAAKVAGSELSGNRGREKKCDPEGKSSNQLQNIHSKSLLNQVVREERRGKKHERKPRS